MSSQCYGLSVDDVQRCDCWHHHISWLACVQSRILQPYYIGVAHKPTTTLRHLLTNVKGRSQQQTGSSLKDQMLRRPAFLHRRDWQKPQHQTSSTCKHYSLDSKDDFRSACRNVSHQRKIFFRTTLTGWSHYANYRNVFVDFRILASSRRWAMWGSARAKSGQQKICSEGKKKNAFYSRGCPLFFCSPFSDCAATNWTLGRGYQNFNSEINSKRQYIVAPDVGNSRS